jgi:Dyp-type peroxidase family
MGSEDGDPSERPPHVVHIRQAFAIGVYPVTFAEWDACVAAGGTQHKPPEAPRNPPHAAGTWDRGRRPVINVGWYDAQEYVSWLSRTAAREYRLPSEAEWEYSARAGTTTEYAFGNVLTADMANFRDGSAPYGGISTSPVGLFPPNAFGLYDVHGNVWEWVQDSRNADTYQGAPTDGSSWEAAQTAFRLLRGGSWKDGATELRSAYRKWSTTGYRFNGGTLGFRVVRALSPAELGVRLVDLGRSLTNFDVADVTSELRGLQAGILKPHARAYVAIVIGEFRHDAPCRAVLRALSDLVTSAMDQLKAAADFRIAGHDGGPVITLHLSGRAYVGLGEDVTLFPAAFVEGMNGARDRLNDPPSGELDEAYRSGSDILLQIAHSTPEGISQALDLVTARMDNSVKILAVETGERRIDAAGQNLGPFGFVDGLSQPIFFRDEITVRPRIWNSEAAPKLVVVRDPLAPDALGSYMVFRKYQTDNPHFQALAGRVAEQVGIDEEFAKALFFGRFPDGTPLALHNRPLSDPTNDFDYLTDPDGTRCPFHAHIRKVNPRGAHEGEGERARRIARRGMAFWAGASWQACLAGAAPTQPTDGLLFIAYQASIVEQFEFIHRVWMNDIDFQYGEFPGADLVAGHPGKRELDPSGYYVIDQEPHHYWPTRWGGKREGRVAMDLDTISTLRGGEYYFTPSIDWLKSL